MTSHLILTIARILTAASILSVLGRQNPSGLPDADRTRIGEAIRLAALVGNRIWPDWEKAPFAILLITSEHEFLVRHPNPSNDFVSIGEDSVLKEIVWFRKRQFSPNLLATFPAVGGVPTIVIGQPQNTDARTSARWVITLLHEHFHQLQNSQPGYYAGVESLGLSRGDQTGIWMLNYAFPYEAAEAKNHFAAMCRSLLNAMRARNGDDLISKTAAYVHAKKRFKSLLTSDDYKYFTFQLWQEGIARYTECKVAEMAARFKPSREFHSLNDSTSFKAEATRIRRDIEHELGTVQLDRAKRTAFYAVGAAEGLLLDRMNPGWRERYFKDRFSLDGHFANMIPLEWAD